MELRIHPTYRPWPRRYTWELFEKRKNQNSDALNFPKVDPPESYLAIIEEWMVKVCQMYIKLFIGVLELTFRLIVKFLKFIIVCVTKFKDIKLDNPNFHRYYTTGDTQLAWDLNGIPFSKRLVGLHNKVKFLPSHYMQTFEEMIQKNFIEGYQSSVFHRSTSLHQRYLLTRA